MQFLKLETILLKCESEGPKTIEIHLYLPKIAMKCMKNRAKQPNLTNNNSILVNLGLF